MQMFQVTENRPHNFSYPQAGFWWLVDRKFEFERQFLVDNLSVKSRPACSFLRYAQA